MSNKQNDIIQETAYEAGYEDALTEQAMQKDIAELDRRVYATEHLYDEARKHQTANAIKILAQQKRMDLISKRIDAILGAVVTAKENE